MKIAHSFWKGLLPQIIKVCYQTPLSIPNYTLISYSSILR